MDQAVDPINPNLQVITSIHNPAGIVLIGLISYHVAVHWKWLITKSRNLASD